MIYVLYAIHVLVCLFLILVVLLQQGKGADLSVFGGGSTQAAFGARGAATLLHKMTVGSFVAFILTTTGIGFLQSGGSQSSVMSTMGDEVPAVEETIEEEAPAEAAAPADASPATDATAGAGAAAEGSAAEGAAADGEAAAAPDTASDGTPESGQPDS